MLGPALLLVEGKFAAEAASQALPIALIATCFFAYSSLSVVILHYLKKRNSAHLLEYYLGERLVRLVISMAVLIIYIMTDRPAPLLFAVNLMVYYLFSMLITSAFQIQTEKKKK